MKFFPANWDGDGHDDRLLVRAPGETVTFLFHKGSHRLKPAPPIMRFSGWQVMDITATNELGDGRWHLLLLMQSQPPKMRVVDCYLEPSKGWQIRELGRWKIPRNFDHVQFLAGDGQVMVVPEPNIICPRGQEETGVWCLRKKGSVWTPQFLRFPYRKDATFMARASAERFGNRFWFYRTLYRVSARGTHEPMSSEVGYFDDGQWQPKFQWLEWSGDLADLNNDNCPELLVFQRVGMLRMRPIFWHRLPDHQWREEKLKAPSLYQILGSGLRQADLVVTPEATLIVQWDSKKWFVIFGDDGFVQAVTLK